MKRLVLTATGTVAGLAALLSFKAQGHPIVTTGGALPSAGTAATGSTLTPTTSSSASSSASSSTSSSASSSASSSTSKPATTAHTYTGQAVTTQYGVVQVKATVAGGKITDVAFVQLTGNDPRSQQINSYAAPQLLQETLQAQSAHVDTVSGASYTSEGYRESLQSALDAAGLK